MKNYEERIAELEILNDSLNDEVNTLKEEMDFLKEKPQGEGSPKTKARKKKKKRTAMFGYDETMEHLKAIGALDDASGRHPQVRIPNYMHGPLNCGQYSSTMAPCCLNECELIMKDIENHVRDPLAAPEDLISLVTNVSTSSVDSPRHLPSGLAQRLHTIAAKNSGQVLLHGRLFAEWLHLAFPNECPFPHLLEDGAMRSVSHWRSADVQDRQLLSEEDKAEQHRLINASEDELHAGPEDFGARPWVEEETLHVVVPRNQRGSFIAGGARVLLLLAMGVVLFRIARASVQEGICSAQGPKFM